MIPKVSVLMPVYNAAPYLREAMDSILGQTYTDFEFLIINDGSTDTSEEIIQSYQDPRIIYEKNNGNLGLIDTLNQGIELAKGKYIVRMDADDISLPERFARQVVFMDAQPKVGACGTAYRFFGDSDQTEVRPADHKRAFTLLASTPCLGHPTSMIRKEVLSNSGIRYEKAYGYAADYAFWVRISQVSRLCSLPETLLLYRWHSLNMSRVDDGRAQFRAKTRILWHELLLGKPLEPIQERYLCKKDENWEIFSAGKNLIVNILENKKYDVCIDRQYYGQLMVTEWESRLIKEFGLRGLAQCFFQPVFRPWSLATPVGLVARYLATLGIVLPGKDKHKAPLHA